MFVACAQNGFFKKWGALETFKQTQWEYVKPIAATLANVKMGAFIEGMDIHLSIQEWGICQM